MKKEKESAIPSANIGKIYSAIPSENVENRRKNKIQSDITPKIKIVPFLVKSIERRKIKFEKKLARNPGDIHIIKKLASFLRAEQMIEGKIPVDREFLNTFL